jgi:chromosome segregation ATPase
MASMAMGMQRGGWQSQARRLALAPLAAANEFTLTDQTPQHGLSLMSAEDHAEELAPAQQDLPWFEPQRRVAKSPVPQADHGRLAELAELRQQIAVKTTSAKMLNERIRKLVAETSSKDRYLAELEDEIAALREDLAHRDNENRSLQTSLDLVNGENLRLAAGLKDSAAEASALRSRMESSKFSLLAAESERDRLTAVLRERSDLHQIESAALDSRLEAMTARTTAMESLLADVRRSLIAKIEENSAAARQVVDATQARDAADAALGELHGSLQIKEHQVRELEQSRSLLLAGAGTLLEAFETRVAALGEAEARAHALADRLAEAEAKLVEADSKIESLNLKLQGEEAGLAEAAETIKSLARRLMEADTSRTLVHENIGKLSARLRSEQASRAAAESALNKVQNSYCRLQRELGNIVRIGEARPKSQLAPQPKPQIPPQPKPQIKQPVPSVQSKQPKPATTRPIACSTTLLLADTISF